MSKQKKRQQQQRKNQQPKPTNQQKPTNSPKQDDYDDLDNDPIDDIDTPVDSPKIEVNNESPVDSPGKMSAKDLKKLRKLRKDGKITLEEYDLKMGIAKAPQASETEILEKLKQEQETSGLIGYENKKGEINTLTRDIHVENFTIAYKGKSLFEDASLHIAYGRKYGLIGPNGMGKSTLLRHISQRHLPIPQHISILHVEQEIDPSEKTALQSVVDSDVERLNLIAEEQTLKPLSKENSDEGLAAQERLLVVYDRLREINAYTAEQRASVLLSGLGFTEKMKEKQTQNFSGGWRMRISLARALFLKPDLLLLDEPTNHLDLDACIWLEEYLRKWNKTLIVVSHDREFLNWVTTDIIHLTHKKLEFYKGNYEGFVRTKEQRKREKQRQYIKDQKEMDKINTKQDLQSKKKKDKMLKKGLTELGKDYKVKFTFRDPEPLDGKIIDIKNITFGFGGEEENLFEDVDLNITLDSKIGIVGPNGVGKSTLVNLAIGELIPTSGEVVKNRKLRIAKFSQHFVDQLSLTDTPITYISSLYPEVQPQEIRNRLGMFGLPGAMHSQPISLLSGGQKSRTIFASLSFMIPHIYFLDEPTNHLDIESVDALADALKNFTGGIIIISHDQRLISSLCNEIWACRGDKSVEIFDGTFEDYRQEIIDKMDYSLLDEEQFIQNQQNKTN